MNIYTFESFWNTYHFVNRLEKVGKTESKRIWENCNDLGKKREAYRQMRCKKMKAYYFLKEILN